MRLVHAPERNNTLGARSRSQLATVVRCGGCRGVGAAFAGRSPRNAGAIALASPRPRFRFAPSRAPLLLPPLPLSCRHTSLPTLPALSRARPSYTGAPLPPHPRGSLRSRLRDPSPLTPDAIAGCPCFGGRALRSCVMIGESSCVALASHHAEAPSRSRALNAPAGRDLSARPRHLNTRSLYRSGRCRLGVRYVEERRLE